MIHDSHRDGTSPGSYTAAVATFRRPGSLRDVLEGLARQTTPPLLIVVADNDPGRSAEVVVAELMRRSSPRVVYLPMERNAGPAGAWAAAVDRACHEPDRGRWVGVFDDDDPIVEPEVMCRLLDLAESVRADVAAVGLRGARLQRRSATLRRVESLDPDSESVDYLASGGAPLYRWADIERVGFFDPELFFGFEDLELGLRLRAAGSRLVVHPLDDVHLVADTAADRTPWREYFKTRALVVICRRHLGVVPLAMTTVRALVLATPVLWARGGASLVRARWRGARDGYRDRLGPRGWAPSANPAKQPPNQRSSSTGSQA